MPAPRVSTLSCLLVPGLVLAALMLTGLTLAGPASAHEERPAQFPSGKGKVPKFLGYDNPNSRVVCTSASPRRIAKMPAGA